MAGSNPYPDSSVVFAFLLILLGSFGVFVLGGVAWHWARARRRALVHAALRRRALRSTWAGGTPRLWDIWPGRAPGAPDGLAGSKPLACQPAERPGPIEPPVEEDPLMYAREVSVLQLIKFTYRTVHPPWRRRQPSPPAAVLHDPSGPGDLSSDCDMPTKTGKVDVAVLVAMPAPMRRRPPDARGDEDLAEYMLGTTRLSLSKPQP